MEIFFSLGQKSEATRSLLRTGSGGISCGNPVHSQNEVKKVRISGKKFRSLDGPAKKPKSGPNPVHHDIDVGVNAVMHWAAAGRTFEQFAIGMISGKRHLEVELDAADPARLVV